MNLEKLKKTVHAITGFSLYDYQLKFLDDCLMKKKVLGVFCRQTGKSTCLSIYVVLFMMEKPGRKVIIVSPTERQSGELTAKIRQILEDNPLLRTEVELMSHTNIRLKNGSTCLSLPCGPEGATIRGFTAHLIVMEEAGHLKDSIVNQVIIPMGASTDAQMIKIGTPFGMNHFFKSYDDKEHWAVHQYDYSIAVKAGHIKQSFIDDRKRDCNSLEFRTEYGAEFIPDQDSYFGYELVRSCIEDVEQISAPRPGRSYVLGVDFARLGEDKTVMIVIELSKDNIEPHRVVYIKELRKTTMDYPYEFIMTLHEHFKFRRMFLDQNGLGAGVSDLLARKYNPRKEKVRVESLNQTYGPQDIVVGVNFTIKSKLDMFSNAKVLMEQGKVKYPNHPTLVFEMQDFRYENTESGNTKLHHPEGGHDDYCDAFALACFGCRQIVPKMYLGSLQFDKAPKLGSTQTGNPITANLRTKGF